MTRVQLCFCAYESRQSRRSPVRDPSSSWIDPLPTSAIPKNRRAGRPEADHPYFSGSRSGGACHV